MCEENAKTLRDFMDDFIANGSDDDAIYMIEALASICKFAMEHPDKVNKFVAKKKKNATKD